MALSHSPSIVTSGLQAYTDPANAKCWINSENLLNYSEQFDNAVWTKALGTVTINATTAPDGTASADKFVESTGSTEHILYRGFTSTSNVTQTFSVYLKAAERTRAYLGFSNFLNYAVQVFFDLSAGTILFTQAPNADYTNVSGTITSVGNGWYRCSITATKGSINTTSNPNITLVNTGLNSSYTGDGTSGIYVWGAQLEYGSSPSDYRATLTSGWDRTRNMTDLSGNGRGVTLYPPVATAPTMYYDPSSKSVVFDGVDDTLWISDWGYPAAWEDSWTASIWMYVPTGATWSNGNRAGFLLRGGYAGNHGLFRSLSDNYVGASIRGATSVATYISAAIGRDAWYNVTGTWTGGNTTVSGTVSLYINGVLQTSAASSPDGTPSATAWHVGDTVALSTAAGSWYTGKVGTTMIYNRVLSSDEIKQNFNALRGRYGI